MADRRPGPEVRPPARSSPTRAGCTSTPREPIPRRGHAYCLDDVARALVVVCREQALGELDDLRDQYLTFVLAAQEPDGRFHNRRRFDLRWSDTASVEDCWGRALWGLGTAVARTPRLRERALACVRPRRPAALTASARHGVRRARRRGGARGCAGPRRRTRADRGDGRRGRQACARPGVAMAGAPAQLRERGAAGGAAGGGHGAGFPVARRGRPRPVGLAARPADQGRAPVGRPGRRLRSRGHRAGVRPAADRGGGVGRRLRSGSFDRRTTALGRRGQLAAAWFLGDNDSGTPMHDPVVRWRLRRSWSASGATRTRARSPLWRCSRRCSWPLNRGQAR